MITNEGMVKITDFGLAKDRYTRSLTQPVSTGGTLYYMSPSRSKDYCYRSSQRHLFPGLTLYEMLAGKIPFRKGDTDFTIREAIVKRQFPPLLFNPQLSDSLDSLVMKLIAKEPDERYQNIDEIKQALAHSPPLPVCPETIHGRSKPVRPGPIMIPFSAMICLP